MFLFLFLLWYVMVCYGMLRYVITWMEIEIEMERWRDGALCVSVYRGYVKLEGRVPRLGLDFTTLH